MKNPYRTLGLSPGASEEEIRTAYRLLAFRHHPDVNPQDPSAQERFKEVQRAYELLSDPVSRESRVSAHESEMDRILKRLKVSLTLISGPGGGKSVVGVSLGKSCLRERTTHHGKPFSPTSGFVRPTPPRRPKAPRSPVSPAPL